MPQDAWTKKQERQYQHIKDQAIERGSSKERAKEIAARTVNKERARSGHATQQSKTSTEDISAYRRGGKRSGQGSGPRGRTKQQLYDDARRLNVPGRSTMTKPELAQAVRKAEK